MTLRDASTSEQAKSDHKTSFAAVVDSRETGEAFAARTPYSPTFYINKSQCKSRRPEAIFKLPEIVTAPKIIQHCLLAMIITFAKMLDGFGLLIAGCAPLAIKLSLRAKVHPQMIATEV
jgi:hypothetical protein